MTGITWVRPLPRIMVAPNGARRTKEDHPALPMTIAETVATAKACAEAGADGLHAHVRNEQGEHVLDAGLYRELIDEMALVLPGFFVQITTEAVGYYSPSEQRALVEQVEPAAVSISIGEMLSEGEGGDIASFYRAQYEKGVAVQHILYDESDIARLMGLLEYAIIPTNGLQLLFVLGRYSKGQISRPEELDPFLASLAKFDEMLDISADWACCAFGPRETECLLRALSMGGKARIGFENNLHHADGTVARDNADRVNALIKAVKEGDVSS